MKIRIRQPQCFSEIGGKDNQEDFLWPLPQEAGRDDRVFLMCDGVGGHDNGEVASRTAATALGTWLAGHVPADGVVTKALFDEALAHAYDALDEADGAGDGVARKKMGTTMTCLALHGGGAMMAHIGDSRVYHVRPSLADGGSRTGIIYQSADHSLVNDLLRAGEITEEEAAHFPQKNVITRAMQPHQERRCKSDVYCTADVQAGDYFFLCCDGVLEQLTNETLGRILADGSLDDQGKLQSIKAVCDGRTHDNYTCWLIPVDRVEGTPVTAEDEETVNAIVEEVPQAVVPPRASAPRKPAARDIPTAPGKRKSRGHASLKDGRLLVKALLGLLLCLCMIGAGTYVGRLLPSSSDKEAPDTVPQPGTAATKPAACAPAQADQAQGDTARRDTAAGKTEGAEPKEEKQEEKREEKQSPRQQEGKAQPAKELSAGVDSLSKAFSKNRK